MSVPERATPRSQGVATVSSLGSEPSYSFFIYRVSKDGTGRRQSGPACGVKTLETGISLPEAFFGNFWLNATAKEMFSETKFISSGMDDTACALPPSPKKEEEEEEEEDKCCLRFLRLFTGKRVILASVICL